MGNGPTNIASGGGGLWVVNSSDDTVVRIDPVSGKVGVPIATGSGADGIAYGAGSLWVTSSRDGTVSRIDPHSRSIVTTVNVGNGARDMTFAAGSLWVANSLDGTISRIDPETNKVSVTIPIGAGPSSVVSGLGSIWVANESGGTLARIDPATNTVRTYELGNRPSGVALSGGSVFVGVHGASPAHRGGTLTAERTACLPPSTLRSPTTPTAWAFLSMTSDGLVGFKRVGGIEGASLVPDLATAIPPSNGAVFAFVAPRLALLDRCGSSRRRLPVRHRAPVQRHSPGVNYYKDIIGAHACLTQPRTCDLSRGVATDDAARTGDVPPKQGQPGLPLRARFAVRRRRSAGHTGARPASERHTRDGAIQGRFTRQQPRRDADPQPLVSESGHRPHNQRATPIGSSSEECRPPTR